MTRSLLRLAGIAILAGSSTASGAFINITLAKNNLYLIVGDVNAPQDPIATTVVMDVPAANVGNGLPIPGSKAVQVQFGFQRTGRPDFTVTLTANVPPFLADSSGMNQIPITDLQWANQPLAGCAQTLTVSPLAAGGNNLYQATVVSNGTYWACGILTFSFLNQRIYPAGTYGGTLTFTVSKI